MLDERSYHATITLAHGYQFVAEFDETPEAAPITFDEPEPLGANRGPNAAAVLGAAIGNCLAASLTFCLRRSHMEVVELTAKVTTHVAKNEQGRHRITGIDVELQPVLGGDEPARIERCADLFEDFCTVTASVKHGIPVHVSLKDGVHQPAA